MNSEFTVYVIKTCKLVIGITLTIFLVRSFIIEPGRVNGRSMEHTFIDEDVFLVNKFILLFRTPQRGDVVQIIEPDTKKMVIKRIIGLPGEQVSLRQNTVFITNSASTTALSEPYLDANIITKSTTDMPTDYPVLGPNEYFVLGDNRVASTDSRVFGAIHRSYIQGTVITLPDVK